MGLGILYWPLVLVLLILIAGIGWMERGHLSAYYGVINDGIKSLSQKLNMRLTPEIHFFKDTTWEEAARMDRLLDSLNIKPEEN